MEICPDQVTPSRRWNLTGLILCHAVIALLVFTFVWPMTRTVWDKLDVLIFRLLNGTLPDHPNWQLFWAFANHPIADWIEDGVILFFFILSIRSATPSFRLRRTAELLFGAFYIALILYVVGRVVFRDCLHLSRESPTLILNGSFLLSDEMTWIKVKDASTKSFPADHATTALLFGIVYSFFAPKRLALCAAFYALFLCIPRLIVGAHWFSDVMVGSCSIILFFMSWAFCSPLQHWGTEHIERGLRRLNLIRKRSTT